jgi:hypothetical protein
MQARFRLTLAAWLMATMAGCVTTKESDTARTGVEQMLISSAVDRSLDKIDFAAVRGAKVYVEEKYLDCVDKNYVFIALHQRLLMNGCTLMDKADDADVVMQIGSGAVGTDRQDFFVGISQIPLPPPSPIQIPQFSLFSRDKANGTAKLVIIAYDAKSKRAVLNSGISLARSDYKSWKVIGAGSVESGSVPHDVLVATGQRDDIRDIVPTSIAGRPQQPPQ